MWEHSGCARGARNSSHVLHCSLGQQLQRVVQPRRHDGQPAIADISKSALIIRRAADCVNRTVEGGCTEVDCQIRHKSAMAPMSHSAGAPFRCKVTASHKKLAPHHAYDTPQAAPLMQVPLCLQAWSRPWWARPDKPQRFNSLCFFLSTGFWVFSIFLLDHSITPSSHLILSSLEPRESSCTSWAVPSSSCMHHRPHRSEAWKEHGQ